MTAPDLFLDNLLSIFPGEANKIANATNAPTTVTLPAVPGRHNAVGLVTVGYSDTPTGGLLTIYDTATPIFQVPITQSNPTTVPVYRYGGENSEVKVVLSAGGSGIVGYVNVEAVTS